MVLHFSRQKKRGRLASPSS